ncbi:carbamoyltransferase N-terminal domain-containing protein [Phytohabitans sp. LJ34]|uniref:carbamoyltransferase N-terminal domain-containing protein n=1 Tax=Phytohabitans sp. LJ34 TaxID=3452217 RepID=UPI003F89BAD2
MIICGAKLTHDGAVALIDGNRLVFSVETEKIDNNPRHSNIHDLDLIFQLLREHGYDPGQVDRFVFDGWWKTERIKPWGDQQVRIELAPYRRGLLDTDLLRSYHLRTLDLEYTSYHHYAGHLASGLCTSPATARGESSYVLCWDGAAFPYLYHYDLPTGKVRSLGPLHYMIGNCYHSIAMAYPPFDLDIEYPQTMSLPGKIMAYVANGSPADAGRKMFDEAYRHAIRVVFGDGVVHDEQCSHRNGQRVLGTMREALDDVDVHPDDMLASLQAFMGDKLVDALAAAIAADGRQSQNLTLVGGCALNIKWNRQIRDSGVCADVWVPPFPNDAGSAIGTACCALMETGRAQLDWDVYAGPDLKPSELDDRWTAKAHTIEDLAHFLHHTGEPVLFLHGRAELGPRALGHRSILAPAVDPVMKDRLNEAKGREAYRPVAPICLEHRAADVFDPGTADPYMLFDHDVRPEWRSRVPAICHIDGTARVQTVNPRQSPEIHALLTHYADLSGIPLLCNTSANRGGAGFFPDLRSAAEWGRVPYIWSDGVLYERS